MCPCPLSSALLQPLSVAHRLGRAERAAGIISKAVQLSGQALEPGPVQQSWDGLGAQPAWEGRVQPC